MRPAPALPPTGAVRAHVAPGPDVAAPECLQHAPLLARGGEAHQVAAARHALRLGAGPGPGHAGEAVHPGGGDEVRGRGGHRNSAALELARPEAAAEGDGVELAEPQPAHQQAALRPRQVGRQHEPRL